MDLVDALEKHVETALIVDDIAWSGDMHRAWLKLKSVRLGVWHFHGKEGGARQGQAHEPRAAQIGVNVELCAASNLNTEGSCYLFSPKKTA